MSHSYYTILGCSETATYEEIKRKYRQLIKLHHPDKQSPGEPLPSNFIEIDKAWKTLRDTDLRKQYDALLVQNKLADQQLIYATLRLSELYFKEDSISCYTCRCGNNYVIDKTLFSDKDEEYLIECEECSYSIVVLNK